jgi:alpha-galactosidase
MLVVGHVGWGEHTRPTQLTGNEQILHLTQWSMLAAPLLIGADLTKLDEFTLALLTNDEVLAVDQDALGKPASRRSVAGRTEVWARPLADGTTAVALYNRGPRRTRVVARWSDLGISGVQPVRDLWRRRDLGRVSDAFEVDVPQHGAVLIKVGAAPRSR